MSNNNYKIKYLKYKKKYLELTNNINGGAIQTSESQYIDLVREEIDKMFEMYTPEREINTCEKNFFEKINNLKLKGSDFESKFNSLKDDIIEIFKLCKKEKKIKNGFMKYQNIAWQYLFLILTNREKMERFINEKLKIRNIDETFFLSGSNPFFDNLKILSGKPYDDAGPFQYIYEEANVKESFITALFVIRNNSGTHLANEIPPNDTEIINIREVIRDYLKKSPEQVLDVIKKGINKIYNEWLFTIEVDRKTKKEIKFPKGRPIMLLNSKLLILIARNKNNTTQPFSVNDKKLNGISIETLRKALRSQTYKDIIKNLKYIDFNNKGYVISIDNISENGNFNKPNLLFSEISERKYNNNGNSYSKEIFGTVFIKSSSKKVKPIFSKPTDWKWDLEQNTFKEIGYTKQNYNDLLKSPLEAFEILIKELHEAKNYFMEIDKFGNNPDEVLKKNKEQTKKDALERIKREGENIVCGELFDSKKEKIKTTIKENVESEMKELFKKGKKDEIDELELKFQQEKETLEKGKQDEIDKLKIEFKQEKDNYEKKKLDEITEFINKCKKEKEILEKGKQDEINKCKKEKEILEKKKQDEINKCKKEKEILEKKKQDEINKIKILNEQDKYHLNTEKQQIANNLNIKSKELEEVYKLYHSQKDDLQQVNIRAKETQDKLSELERKENALIQAHINIEKAEQLRIKRDEQLKKDYEEIRRQRKRIIDSKKKAQPIINSVLESAAEAGRIMAEKAIVDKAVVERTYVNKETENKPPSIFGKLKKYQLIKLFK